MARQFTMGARINLQAGGYSSSMSEAARATGNLQSQVINLDSAMGRYTDSQGRLREANGRYVASAGTATRQMQAQENQTSSLRSRTLSLADAFHALVGAMAIKKGFDWLVGANADMEQYQNTLTVVMGSQKKAIDMLAWAQKFAAQTPFEIPQVVEATVRMQSYGINAKKTIGIVGDMASVMGKDLMQAVEAVADAQTGELERLKEFGLTKKMIQDQAKAMGKNPINNKGQITDTKAFNAALFALMNKRFKGGMAMQSKSFKGMLSNASDFMGSLGRQLGKPLFDKLKVGLGDLLTWLNKLQSSGQINTWIKNIQAGFAVAGNVISTMLQPVKALFALFTGHTGKGVSMLVSMGLTPDAINSILSIVATIKNTFKTVGSVLANSFTPAKKAIDGIKAVLLTFVNFALANLPKIEPYVIGIATAFGIYFGILKLVNLWTKIVTISTAAWNAVMDLNPVMLVVLGIGLLIGYLIHLAGGWDVVKAKLISFLPVLQALWSKIVTAIMPILRQLWTVALSVFNSFKTILLPVILSVINSIVAVFASLVGWIRAHWSTISVIIAAAWAAISSYISAGIAIAKAIIVGGFQVIAAVIQGVWGMIEGVVQVAWSVLHGMFNIGLNLLKGNWKGAWDAMLGMLKGVWGGIKKFFGSLGTMLFKSGKAILHTLADGITAAAMAPVNAVKGAFKKLRKLLPFSDAKEGPLSQLTLNGSKIVTTMAEGIHKQRGAISSAMNSVLGETPGSNGITIQPGTANPAGSQVSTAGNVTKSVTIQKLFDNLHINGADGKNGKELAHELITHLVDILGGADEIESAGLGDLLV